MNASLSEDSVAETALSKKNSDGKRDEAREFSYQIVTFDIQFKLPSFSVAIWETYN